MIRRRKSFGFTIVELLIVIVVIAILATITITAFNGVQARATTSRTVQSGSSYAQALLAYYSLNGTYPALSSGNGGACLGANYSDRNNDGVGDCGETAFPVQVDPTFNTALKTILSALPDVNDATIPMPYQTSTWVGMSFHYYPPNSSDSNLQTKYGFTVDGVSQPYYLMYIVNGGNTNCSLPGLVIPDTSQFGWPKMTKSIPAGQSWSWSDGKTTSCLSSLPSK
jgi:prepilin-type N-terminal cleavage/methylation domain-containing protein